MAKTIVFEGRSFVFPDDATDDEIAEQLEALSLNVPAPAPGKPLSAREKVMRQNVAGDPDLARENAEAEHRLRGSNMAALDEAIAQQKDPQLKALLQQERAKVSGMPAAPDASQKPAADEPVQAEGTLAERMEQRAELEKQDAALRTQELQLTRQWQRGNAPMASAETKARAEVAGRALEQVQILRAQLKKQIEATGVGSTGRTVGGLVGGIGGGLLGGAVAAPSGPGALIGMGVGGAAGTAAGSALGTKIDIELARRRAVEITPEEAMKMIGENALTDALWDGVGTLIFLGGNKLFRVMGDRALLGKLRQDAIDALTKKRAGLATAKQSAAAGELFDPATPASRLGAHSTQEAREAEAAARAVQELGARSGGAVPTPGQITGEAGYLEKAARATRPGAFDDAAERLQQGAKTMRSEIVEPVGQPSSKAIGSTVVDMIDNLETTVKNQTGPVFEAAANAKFVVNPVSYANTIEELLARNAKANNGLVPGEVPFLQGQLDALRQRGGLMDGPGTLDLVSALKHKMRDLEAKGELPPVYKKYLGDMIKNLEGAYEIFARTSGNKKVYDDLMQARELYGSMAETAFDTEMKKAMRTAPENVGKLLYTRGHISGLDQLEAVQKLAVQQKSMTKEQVEQMNADVMRGFLASAMPDITAASKWSDSLSASKPMRETFERLQAMTGTKQITDALDVLQQAAKISLRNKELGFELGPLAGAAMRARHGALGVGYATGFISLPLIAAGISLDGAMKAFTTALTRGDKGVYRDLVLVLKAGVQPGGTAARGPVRAAAGRLAQWGKENGVDLFQSNPEVVAEEQE